jgi:hypothetical protein
MINEIITILEFNQDGTYTVSKSRTYTSKEEAYKAAGITEGKTVCQPSIPIHMDVSEKYFYMS